VARLGRDLDADTAIAACLDEHGTAPCTGLRGAWLADLGRRKQWEVSPPYGKEIDRAHMLRARRRARSSTRLEEAIAALTPRVAQSATRRLTGYVRGRSTAELIERRSRAHRRQITARYSRNRSRSTAAPVLQ
jgi:hypothetical protein